MSNIADLGWRSRLLACVSWFVLSSTAVTVDARTFSAEFSMPQSVTVTPVLQDLRWRGLRLEVDRLSSRESIERILDQLAERLPAYTPVWVENGSINAYWDEQGVSRSLMLWLTPHQRSEGLLVSVHPEQRPLNPAQKAEATDFNAWLAPDASKVFHLSDRSGQDETEIAAFTSHASLEELTHRVRAHAARNLWLKGSAETEISRGGQRMAFFLRRVMGQTTVLVHRHTTD